MPRWLAAIQRRIETPLQPESVRRVSTYIMRGALVVNVPALLLQLTTSQTRWGPFSAIGVLSLAIWFTAAVLHFGSGLGLTEDQIANRDPDELNRWKNRIAAIGLVLMLGWGQVMARPF
jgi:hypothetical protein